MAFCRNGTREMGCASILLAGLLATALPARAQNIDLGGLLKGVIGAVAQQGMSQGKQSVEEAVWKFHQGYYGRKPSELHTKSVCLDVDGAGLFAKFKVSLLPLDQLRRCPGFFWVNVVDHEIILDADLSMLTHVSETDPVGRAVYEAKQAGIFSLLEQSAAIDKENETKKQRQDYLDAFESVGSLEDIRKFESKYAANDPDGLIPILQQKKNEMLRREHQIYREAFANAKTSDQLTAFLSNYRDNDPEGFVPLAQKKLADIRSNEQAAEKARMAQEQAFERAKRAQLVSRYSTEINKLGFHSTFLKSNIYLRDGWNSIKYLSYETWLAKLFDSGNYSRISAIKAGNAQGVLLKRPGSESMGIFFRMDGGELFPSHMLGKNDRAIPMVTAGEQQYVTMMIVEAARRGN